MPAPDQSRPAWRKSSYSNGSGGSCVEIAILTTPGHTRIAIRDSKNPNGPTLTVTPAQWHTLTTAIKNHNL